MACVQRGAVVPWYRLPNQSHPLAGTSGAAVSGDTLVLSPSATAAVSEIDSGGTGDVDEDDEGSLGRIPSTLFGKQVTGTTTLE